MMVRKHHSSGAAMLTKENTKSSRFSSTKSFDENAPEFIADMMARVKTARNPRKRISIDELFTIVADKRKALHGR
jgi:hypothetical protein